ncbi:MAG: hypothetical protein COX62_03640 [Deltaproteobacteria bacterium CG_4_10_14_0_2_um_filter_43_8]|nr:MAG: hypothetical protein COV43_05725 [Deltaproteobacteria bacterium CG11_big_fil_rev_8_21_14_0_20_42_23]PJA20976.1 MAG: hypothetical protein COX62_03640 [Deltaproteobacteria bacterium CG_4_10_14_0_2_um_filter_43_8]PJC63664.1 MAG: hypothetical protein CO021_08245 [Deltaproteobacteria bacterium CG_4_9_14_0_2_um_filter_42_21]
MTKKKQSQTKIEEHVLNLGRDLLHLSNFMFSFCKDYAEKNKHEMKNEKIIHFFDRALSVTQDLCQGLENSKGKTKPSKKNQHDKKTKKNH